MSYGAPPGMAIYPTVVDAPSGVYDYPSTATTTNPAVSANVAYSASFNVGTALVIVAVLWFGAVATMHYISNASGKL